MENKKISQLDPYSGNPDSFDIPGVADGQTLKTNLGTAIQQKITSQRLLSPSDLKTVNGVPLTGQGDIALELVHPFKGWYDSLEGLQTAVGSPAVGDYAYIKSATAGNPAAIYECATAGTWTDSGRTVDTSNVQTFATGQQVNSVNVKNENGDDDSNAQGVLSSEAGAKLSQKLNEVENTVGEYDKDDFEVYQVDAGYTTPKADGNRIRVIKYLPTAADITVQSQLAPGVAAGLYETLEKALVASGTSGEYIENISGYTTNKIEYQTAQGGYLSISFRNSTGTGISAEEKTAMLESLQLTVKAGIVRTVEELDTAVPQLASRVENIEENLSEISHFYKYASGYLAWGGSVDASDDWVYTTDYIPANFGDDVVWKMGSDGGSTGLGYLIVYNSEKAMINIRSPYGFTPQRNFTLYQESDTGVAYVRCSFYLRDIAECFLKINGVTVWAYRPMAHPTLAERVTALERAEGDNDYDYDILPLGEIAMVSGTSTVAETPYVAAVPYLGVDYKITLPSALKVRFMYGANRNVPTSSGWLVNGDAVTIPPTSMFQKVQFSNADGSALTASDVKDYINSGDVVLMYKKREPHIEIRNYGLESFVKAAMLTCGTLGGAGFKYSRMLSFAHISDIHGDSKRFENAARYASILGVDAFVSTGDSVIFYGQDGSKFMRDVLDKYPSLPFLSVIGNHEVNMQDNTTAMANKYFTNAQIFSDFIQPYLAQGGYLQSADTAATMPYYYVDFSTKSMRIIVLNQYDSGVYGGETLTGRMGQDQLVWLCDTLAATPSDYGVIIAMHSIEAPMTIPEDFAAWNQKYTPGGSDDEAVGYGRNGLYDNALRPIRSIVDAFISRGVANFNYTLGTTYGNDGGNVSINYDFSDAAAEFVCYVTGHRHADAVGYVSGSQEKQLIINICSGSCYTPLPSTSGLSFAEAEDLPRGDKGVVQDAFNVYTVDTVNGRVKIARVGSSVNFEGEVRDFLMADYR